MTVNISTQEERNEKAEAALKQLLTCARAECGECTLVPEPDHWKECVQVMDTCEEILRESLGIPAQEESRNEVNDGEEAE